MGCSRIFPEGYYPAILLRGMRKWPGKRDHPNEQRNLTGRSCGRLRLGGQRELKSCSRTIIRCCPKTAVMSLDYGLTDVQSDSHSIVLGGIEGLEEFVRGFRWEAVAHIFHAKTYPIQPLSFGSDEQLPPAIIYRAHRVGSIAYQIKNHLLELDTIPFNQRKIIGKLRFQDHPMPLKIAQRQCEHLFCGLVQ